MKTLRVLACLGLMGLGAFSSMTACSGPVSPVVGAMGLDVQEGHEELFREAEAHRQAGDLEKARDLYHQAIQRNPDLVSAYRFLGETLLRLGQSREAVRILERATERLGEQADLLRVLGVAYGPEGRIADSVRTLQRLLEIEPSNVTAWANLGASLEQLGKLGEARKAFEKALALDPAFLFARNRLGRLLLMIGDLRSARRHLEHALRLDPASTDARYQLSRVLRAEGEDEQADVLFHQAFGLPPPNASVRRETLARGRELSRVHCARCHPAPRPDSLPRRTWPVVSVWMGNYLGFRQTSEPFATLVSRAHIPEQPLIGREDFHAIHHYLTESAPSALPAQAEKPEPRDGTKWFRVSSLASDRIRSDWITLVHIDSRRRRLLVGEGGPPSLSFFTPDGRFSERVALPTQPVAVQTRDDGFDLTLIGDFDVDRRRGQVLRFEERDQRRVSRSIVEGYFRTSHAVAADLTGNGREDEVVCGFGDFDQGRFAWFEDLGGGRYREHVLIDRSGALRVEVRDFTEDGRPDLLVLLAQARQELVLFENLGKGKFQARQLLEQFPGFGYNDFLVADFNGDGHEDLVTVNGNNMELDDPPLRPYHGVRLYLNDGRMNFTEKYFYPMYGALR
ncbi:MAG: tetratricopeptide repeat protein, partial [Vicinamibacteraceae bacterium]